MLLTVCTYNIHSCVGVDRRRDPARILAVLHEIGADIIGLQEVDDNRSGPDERQFEFFPEATGFHFAAGPTMRSERGWFGNLLLSRWPINHAELVNLTISGRHPRSAIDAELQVEDRHVRIVVAHLGLLPDEQFRQVRALARRLGNGAEHPALIMGDFNVWGPARPLFRQLGAKGVRRTALPSFPAWAPRIALDRVWSLPTHLVRQRRVHRTALSARASDHLPVVATVLLNGLGG